MQKMNGKKLSADDIIEEKTISSDEIYNGKVIRVTRDTVSVPGGTAYREIVHHHGGVCCGALNDRGEIALVSQYRYAYGRIVTELPAGKLEQGEQPFDAIKRELREEIGAEGRNWRFLGRLYPSPGYDNEIIWLYTCDIDSIGDTHFDDDEQLAEQYLPLEEAVRLVMNGDIPDSKSQTIILKLAVERGITMPAGNTDPGK